MTAQPAQKHRDLADWMIASHGEELSRYIVDFTKIEADRTNFKIATFGAVANYIDRAVTHHTLEQARIKREEEAAREAAREELRVRAYQEREQRGFALYRALPEDERRRRLSNAMGYLATTDRIKTVDFSNAFSKVLFEKDAEQLVREQ
ncbi:MAG: hypothetical protein UZ17_ACD001002617, partial [Acidobacteria bacterium OLB17]